jgi:26S proteasome regulatory subunit N13
MFPGDGTFTPYTDPKNTSKDVVSPTNGRIFQLKFSSSSQQYFFWLQSKPQHPSGKPNYFSERDLKLGNVVNDILQGEEVDVQTALSQSGPGRPDEDEDMDDAPGADELQRTSTGGAGPDATGGDFRKEGEESREGGADGARA